MKFAHLADCHLGGWREPKLRELNLKAFVKAVDTCLEQNLDFVLISGDLFNTAVPGLDSLRLAVTKLKELKDKEVNVYLVPGSHDYSPSGKTILDVLEGAGLVVNVASATEKEDKLVLKFTEDKTGAFITGLPGRKGTLEKGYYQALDRSEAAKQKGYKIFLFHTALTEFKPKELEQMDSTPISLLPKGFDYYAGGHVHHVFQKKEPGYGTIAFPGPLFPNNFKEQEDLGRGGFYLVEDGKLDWQPVQVVNSISIKLDCNHMSPEEVEAALMEQFKNKEFNETLITLRLYGTLKSGKPTDIDFKKIFEALYQKSAYFVMKNTNKLAAKGFEEVKVEQGSVEEIEKKIIDEHLGQIKGFTTSQEKEIINEMMRIFSKEKEEGEKVADFEKRLLSEVSRILKIE